MEDSSIHTPHNSTVRILGEQLKNEVDWTYREYSWSDMEGGRKKIKTERRKRARGENMGEKGTEKRL